MGQGASPEDIRQLTRYSAAHLLVCLPFVALGGFGVIPPWVFAAVSVPLGAAVGLFTLRPRRAGVLAGMAGTAVAGVLSGALSAAGLVFDPRVFQDPRWTTGLAVGALFGCFAGWYVWDVIRGPQPPAGDPPHDAAGKGGHSE
jgi:hypothetical protein